MDCAGSVTGCPQPTARSGSPASSAARVPVIRSGIGRNFIMMIMTDAGNPRTLFLFRLAAGHGPRRGGGAGCFFFRLEMANDFVTYRHLVKELGRPEERIAPGRARAEPSLRRPREVVGAREVAAAREATLR